MMLKVLINIQLNINVKDKSKTLGEDIVVQYSIITNTIYINNDITYIRYHDYYRNLYYNGEGYDSSFQDGVNIGIEQNRLEMIERILKNNVDYETISYIIEKTIEQIKEIEKGL